MDLFDIAVAKKLSGGGGGGGAVHHTYEGTVADIMTKLSDYSAFATLLKQGTAFARLTATLGADTATLTVVSINETSVQASLQFISYNNGGISTMTEYVGLWGQDAHLIVFERIDVANENTWSSTNYAPMASQVPCVLEVVQFYGE